jgi:class 3 adenylate cyclase
MVRIHLSPAESPQTIGSAGDFTRLIPIIQNNAGSIVKFLGNGVIATFGVARPSPAYAADAIVALGRVRCPGSLLFAVMAAQPSKLRALAQSIHHKRELTESPSI